MISTHICSPHDPVIKNLSAIKANQGNYEKYARHLLEGRPVDLVGELERGHGTFEERDITIAAVDTEVRSFPHIAQVIKSSNQPMTPSTARGIITIN